MSGDRSRKGCVVFVGNLPSDMREHDVEDALNKFGHVHRVELKSPLRPPAFAFVEFADASSADEAVREGEADFRGTTLRIESVRSGQSSMSSYARGGGRSSRSPYRVLVKGLPPSASWQDVKDHFRKVVDPTFAKVYNDRDRLYGVVEFNSYDDLKYAIRKLDDTEFKNRYDRAYIRVINDSERSPSSSESYSRSRSRSRSKSKGKRRHHDSESDSRSRSYSYSRSRSRHSRSSSRSRSYSDESGRSRSPVSKEEKRSKHRDRSGSPHKDDATTRHDEHKSHRSSEERRD